MLKYKTYVKILSLMLITVFGGAFIYVYIYAKSYPIPLFHRLSLDAKMRFIRDLNDKDHIDTIIIGSSIGLNNLQGVILENSSKKVKRVLNLSSLGLTTTQVEQIIKLISLFPNTKRVIYSSQIEDWLGSFLLADKDIDLAKKYIQLGKGNIDLSYTFYAYKHFIEFTKHIWEWEKKYANNITNHGLAFDHTGSVPLDMYGDKINHKMFSTPPIDTELYKENPLALERIVKELQSKNIRFYFVVAPMRQYMIDTYNYIHIMEKEFIHKSEKITINNGGKFIDLHKKLHLGDKYFVDREHLNSKGSLLTAKEVAAFIDTHE